MKNWSRKRKLMLCIILMIVSVLFIASLSNRRSPTLEIAVRRAEKQQLIGPAQIIAVMDFDNSPWDHLVLGQTEQGCITYEYRDDLGWDNGDLNFYPKEPGSTLFCTEYWYRADHEEWLPILLFPEKQNSAKSTLKLTITIEGETKTYQLEGERKDSSYYLFSLPTEELGGKHFWLLQQALTGAYSEYVLTGTVEIQIDYYDISGALVDTYKKNVTK